MKKYILSLLVLICAGSLAHSQDVVIKHTNNSDITLNKVDLTEGIDTLQMVELMGAPSRSINYFGTEKSFFYDEVGLVFMTVDGKVKGLGITFNTDGDKKFSPTSFTGTLFLGELKLTKDTHSEEVATIQAVEMICPAPIMCLTKNREALVKAMPAFSEDGTITQIIFLFPEEK